MNTEPYRVQPGDTLIKIIAQRYGFPPKSELSNRMITEILQVNSRSSIPNPSSIFAGSIIRLPLQIAPSAKVRHTETGRRDLPIPFEDWKSAESLSMNLGTFLLEFHGTAFEKQGIQTLQDLKINYQNYSSKKINRYQYNKNRTAAINRLKAQLGTYGSTLVNGGPISGQTLRINRGPTKLKNVDGMLRRYKKLRLAGSIGSIALAGLEVGMACQEAANNDNVTQQNQILVESLGSVVGSSLGGIGASVVVGLLVSNPAGWAVVGLVAIAGTAGAYAAGEVGKVGARMIYDSYGKDIDITRACIFNPVSPDAPDHSGQPMP